MSIMPGPEPDSLFAVVNEPPATPRKRPRRVNSSVRPEDRERLLSNQDVIRGMLLDGLRFDWREVFRRTGYKSTVQRIEELRKQGMVIKSDINANRCADYWMLPEDIAAWKASEARP